MPTTSGFLSHRYLRLLLVAVAILMCAWAIRATAKLGLSHLYARYALVNRSLDAANAAIDLTPQDAQAHLTAATVTSLAGSPGETNSAVLKALALRPADYSLWIALGLTRDQLGDTAGAIAAFDQAVQRAPFYSQPHWQRGNVLLRAGQYEAAFRDLNYAAQSNPELIPRMIDLAWGLTNRDPAATESLARIQTPKMRVAFARLLAREGKPQEAIAQWKAAGLVGDDIQRELVRNLLAKQAFREAHTVWATAKGPGFTETALLVDGGFEGQLILNEEGFGWRVAGDSAGVSLTLDATDRNSGAKSISINFQGESPPSSPLLSQLVLVEPSARYRLTFAARTREIVSGGPPIVAVADASDGKRLAQSTPLNKGTADWQVFSFEFTTPPAAGAILVNVQRETCTTSPCPIFGTLALDSFSLERLK